MVLRLPRRLSMGMLRKVKRTLADGTIVYDFYKVPVHEIDFAELTEK